MKDNPIYANLPQSPCFVITHDHLDPGMQFADATPEQIEAIKADGFTVKFKMYDDDDILYYSGYLLTKYEGSETAFAPLDDYGSPNAGCVDIRYKEKDGLYHSL